MRKKFGLFLIKNIFIRFVKTLHEFGDSMTKICCVKLYIEAMHTYSRRVILIPSWSTFNLRRFTPSIRKTEICLLSSRIYFTPFMVFMQKTRKSIDAYRCLYESSQKCMLANRSQEIVRLIPGKSVKIPPPELRNRVRMVRKDFFSSFSLSTTHIQF